jgi:hypothetical protein
VVLRFGDNTEQPSAGLRWLSKTKREKDLASERSNMKGVLSLFSSEKIALDTQNCKRVDDYANVRSSFVAFV